jgi:hypothetical protein
MAEDAKELDENARREFLSKAAAAVGALAAAGLASSLVAEEAEAGTATLAAPAVAPRLAVGQKVNIRRSPLRYQKLQDGHSFEVESAELTNILAREGLFTKDLMGKQALMRVEIRYSL